jgi:hypothetical protein
MSESHDHQDHDHADHEHDETEGEQKPEEFLNRAARRAQSKGGSGRAERVEQSSVRPTRSGSGPSTRQFSNRRTGG